MDLQALLANDVSFVVCDRPPPKHDKVRSAEKMACLRVA